MIERIKITSREQWLAGREKDITASAAGALLGVHPYMTAFSLYLLKAKLITEDPEETPPMRRGRLLESVAVQMLREDQPTWTIHDHPVGYYYRDPVARIGATPDVLATDEHGKMGIVQIKSVEPSIFRRDWKNEDGSIEPPLWIVCQAIIEAHLTGADWAAVAPMVIGFGVELPVIPIPIHAGILDRIKAEVATFWQRIDEGRNYEPDFGRDGSLIAKLYPQDNGVEIDLSGDNRMVELVDALEKARKAKKLVKDDEDLAKNEIASKMGEAAIARLADGRRVTNKTQERNVGCKHMPGLFCSQSEFRVMRLVKGL
jgi:hypothetical protein